MKDKIRPHAKITEQVLDQERMNDVVRKSVPIVTIYWTSDETYAIGFHCPDTTASSIVSATAVASALAKCVGPERAMEIISEAIMGT